MNRKDNNIISQLYLIDRLDNEYYSNQSCQNYLLIPSAQPLLEDERSFLQDHGAFSDQRHASPPANTTS